MKLGYARVSTDDQETHLQIGALQAPGCDRIYQETASNMLMLAADVIESLGSLLKARPPNPLPGLPAFYTASWDISKLSIVFQ